MDLATALANADLVWWPTVIRSFDLDTEYHEEGFALSLSNLGTALADSSRNEDRLITHPMEKATLGNSELD